MKFFCVTSLARFSFKRGKTYIYVFCIRASVNSTHMNCSCWGKLFMLYKFYFFKNFKTNLPFSFFFLQTSKQIYLSFSLFILLLSTLDSLQIFVYRSFWTASHNVYTLAFCRGNWEFLLHPYAFFPARDKLWYTSRKGIKCLKSSLTSNNNGRKNNVGSQHEAQLNVKSNQMERKASERYWTSDVETGRNTSGVQECGDKNSSCKKKKENKWRLCKKTFSYIWYNSSLKESLMPFRDQWGDVVTAKSDSGENSIFSSWLQEC